MRPTENHLPVERWVSPAEFSLHIWPRSGLYRSGLGALVRSSYRADRVFERSNLSSTNPSAAATT